MSNGWGTTASPDWAALAEANERETRRKRLLQRIGIGAGLGAVVLIGAGVALVAAHRSGAKQAEPPAASTASTGSAAPSGTPPKSAVKGGENLRLGSGAQLGPADGQNGPALTLPGTSDAYAESRSAGVDTSRSFTVSAVVRNDAPAEPKAAVSQGGDAFFAYYLGREDNASMKIVNQWVFKVETAADPGKTIMALSGTPAAAGRWTTLTGVYDAKAGTIALYVDGVLAKSTPVPGITPAGGPVEIGRARYKSHWADAWNGGIADVQVWDRTLSATDITQLAATGSVKGGALGSWLRP